jgi:glutathione S-transferase
MADELVLYTNPMSRGRIARWMLEEVGEAYRSEILEYAGSMKAPAYLAINPMGKVPTLRHGETIVSEVAAICAYLGDVFPEAGLAPPPGSRLRGPYYRWLFFAAGPIEAANTNKALGVVVPPERTRMVGYGSQERALAALEDQLKRSEYIAGDRFTAADVYVGSHLGFGMMFNAIDKRPAFERYWGLVSARPAARRVRSTTGSWPSSERSAKGGQTPGEEADLCD